MTAHLYSRPSLYVGDQLGPPIERWRQCPAALQPDWPDRVAVDRTVDTLRRLPAPVPAAECSQLRTALAAAARGEALVLQAGSCAESFDDDPVESVLTTVRTIVQMSAVLSVATRQPVVRIGRIAGQYYKPRSAPVETQDGISLPAYRGDGVNGPAFTAEARAADPGRMLTVYERSVRSTELVRRLGAGHAALDHPVAADVDRTLRLLGARGEAVGPALFTSHEALVLDYEAALTRVVNGVPSATSGHMLWVGERTRQVEGAHVEYLAAVDNPIGVKLGPDADPDTVVALVDRLDPRRTPGRLTLICRMGVGLVREKLPPLVRAAARTGSPALWMCDPMHGNTVRAENGYKTRHCRDIIREIEEFLAVHRREGTVAGGIHLEISGDDVTECLGGIDGTGVGDLGRNYTSRCDPRLSRDQALEVAFHLAAIV